MKRLLIMLFYFCVFQWCWGQLKVKIGNDTIFCPENVEKGIQLAPHLSVTGGVPPYTYCWETTIRPFENWDAWFYASSYLNDTTLSNPLVIDSSIYDWAKFKLTVKDSQGQSSQDSINIRFSHFYGQLLGEYPIFVSEGDSVLFDLSDIDIGGIHPYRSYLWSPTEGLSNPTASQTWCKPTKETRYFCQITDSMCCRGYGGGHWIIVHHVSIPSLDNKTNDIYQLGQTIYFNNEIRQVVHLKFYDSFGKLIYREALQSDSYTPDFVTSGQILICLIEINQIQHTLKYIAP